MNQLALPVVTDADVWQQILDAVRDIIRARGNKDAAFALDMAGSDLSNALAERNRTELKLKHLVPLLRIRHSDELPRIIAQAAGLDLAPLKPLTAAEKLERLEGALARAGAAGQAIVADAFGWSKVR